MEQKTEASQAVDEKAALVAVGEKMAKWLAALARSPLAYDSWIDTCRDLSMQWDAALKAQPAPTEAAQFPNTPEIDALLAKWDDDGATRGAAFIELRDKARQIERAFYAAVEQVRTMAEAAQGEDSARLDFIEKHAIKGGTYKGITSANVILHEGEWHELGLRAAIDAARARASAETGWVKP